VQFFLADGHGVNKLGFSLALLLIQGHMPDKDQTCRTYTCNKTPGCPEVTRGIRRILLFQRSGCLDLAPNPSNAYFCILLLNHIRGLFRFSEVHLLI
jgi:hypothetical protein